MLGNGPQVLGNGNGPLVLGNGPHLLGIMSHSALCRIRHYVAFGVMSFGIMSHSALCRIRPYVVRLCVVRRIVVRHNVVRRNVVRHNVGVSLKIPQQVSNARFSLLQWRKEASPVGRIRPRLLLPANAIFPSKCNSQEKLPHCAVAEFLDKCYS